MLTELRKLFYEVVLKEFDFVTMTSKFRGPYIVKDNYYFEVAFIGKNLAIELVFEERDEAISCYIARMIEGQPAQDFAVDKAGKRVRGYLYHLLIAWGVHWPRFTKVTGLSLKEMIPIVLRDYAQMLKEHGQMVMEDVPAFLDVPEPSSEVIREFIKSAESWQKGCNVA